MLDIPGFTYPVTEYYLEDLVKMAQYRPNLPSMKKALASNDPVLEAARRSVAEPTQQSVELDSWEQLSTDGDDNESRGTQVRTVLLEAN